MRTIKNPVVLNVGYGTIKSQDDGTYAISDIITKSCGRDSNCVSIGKFSKYTDDFGDEVMQWLEYSFPDWGYVNYFGFNFTFGDGFRFSRKFKNNNGEVYMYWEFIVPQSFLEQGFAIALIGTVDGSSRYRNEDVKVFFDNTRLSKE